MKKGVSKIKACLFDYSFEEERAPPVQEPMYVLDTEQGTIRYTSAEAVEKLRFDIHDI